MVRLDNHVKKPMENCKTNEWFKNVNVTVKNWLLPIFYERIYYVLVHTTLPDAKTVYEKRD